MSLYLSGELPQGLCSKLKKSPENQICFSIQTSQCFTLLREAFLGIKTDRREVTMRLGGWINLISRRTNLL